MEDDKSTATADAADTSNEEEALATETELENSDVSFTDEDDDSEDDETEESEESDEDESANESEEETEEKSTDDDDQELAEDATSDAEKKKHNDEMAKKRIADREEREAKKRSIKEAQQKYISEGEDGHDIALRQLKVDAYNNKVERNTDHLQNSLDKAVAHIDLFKSKSPEVKEALFEAIDDFEAMNVVKDQYGNYIEVNGDLFEYLQRKADSIRKLTGVGERKSVQSKAKTKSRTVATPSRAPKPAKTDPLLEGFDEEANRY